VKDIAASHVRQRAQPDRHLGVKREVEAGGVLGGTSTRHIKERMTRVRVWVDGEAVGAEETMDHGDDTPPAR
jgi:hypothetical protein